MRKILSLLGLLLFSFSVASAQVSVSTTVPAATPSSQGVVQPGQSMTINGGILDCVAQNSYDPVTGLVFINGVQVTNITLTQATFTGTSPLPDGTYLTTLTNNVVGYTPYKAPVSSVGTVYTVSQSTQTSGQVVNYLIPNLIISQGQVFSFTPNVSGAPAAWPSNINNAAARLIYNSTGTWLQVGNYSNTNLAPLNWTLTVK